MALAAILLALPLAACAGGGDDSPPPTATDVAIVWQLATVAPTETGAASDAATALPTATPSPTITPEPTPYIGVFQGEAEPLPEGLGGAPAPPPRQGEGVTVRNPLNCDIAPDAAFGDNWATETRAFNSLRCPIQALFGFEASVQVFERGAIYWREDTGEIWAIAPGGFAVTGEHWSLSQLPLPTTGDPAAGLGLDPPGGLLLPTGAIGAVWASLPAVRDALGFAQTEPQNVGVNVQRFEGGSLFRDVAVGQVFALLNDGTAYGPYEGAASS